ncbi:hypothetical protein [Porphyromonas sp. COT-239 OH1446]|uniref:hypothetical protein n=1 Tax=Porphyromonas sp. COT-239 OH1446 TaxID=1515613 RepID=UPI00052BDC40|nr:hypothetical protein [Porphyromonas sp. COT-239 OH1446]KGN68405.1 hypothetical protein HQ37_06380 [Porphyromonas sp. COT-239 OH1446]
MLISTNREAETKEFEGLLERMVLELKTQAVGDYETIKSLHGSKLERYAYEILLEQSRSTNFEGSIELVSGQFFPDIIAKRFYGVEVKTSKSGTWRTIGSSVAEGTRIKDIERIYLLFGKLTSPIDFRCRLYQECLSNVAVTHSPRYTIDMDLPMGETFFDKLNIPYDVLRKQESPLDTVISYFRNNLKPGETTWWLSSNSSKATNAIVRLWSSLDRKEAENLKIKGFCLFPELLGRSQHKFHRMLLWLSTEEGVVVGNLRDQFTAGGKELFEYKSQEYKIPQILYRLILHLEAISKSLNSMDITLLEEYWGTTLGENDRFEMWSELVSRSASEISDFPLLSYILEKYQSD